MALELPTQLQPALSPLGEGLTDPNTTWRSFTSNPFPQDSSALQLHKRHHPWKLFYHQTCDHRCSHLTLKHGDTCSARAAPRACCLFGYREEKERFSRQTDFPVPSAMSTPPCVRCLMQKQELCEELTGLSKPPSYSSSSREYWHMPGQK